MMVRLGLGLMIRRELFWLIKPWGLWHSIQPKQRLSLQFHQIMQLSCREYTLFSSSLRQILFILSKEFSTPEVTSFTILSSQLSKENIFPLSRLTIAILLSVLRRILVIYAGFQNRVAKRILFAYFLLQVERATFSLYFCSQILQTKRLPWSVPIRISPPSFDLRLFIDYFSLRKGTITIVVTPVRSADLEDFDLVKVFKSMRKSVFLLNAKI